MFGSFMNKQLVRIEKVLSTVLTNVVLLKMFPNMPQQLHGLVKNLSAQFALEPEPKPLFGTVRYHPEVEYHFLDLEIPKVGKVFRQRGSGVVLGQNVRILVILIRLLLLLLLLRVAQEY